MHRQRQAVDFERDPRKPLPRLRAQVPGRKYQGCRLQSLSVLLPAKT
jgi:hypothetical protein